MTSTWRATTSVTIARERLGWPSAERRSIMRFLPSVHPRSRKRCTKTRVRGFTGLDPAIPEAGALPRTNATIRIFPGCCASAASGAARSTTPVPARNVRRSITRSSSRRPANRERGNMGRGAIGSGRQAEPSFQAGASPSEASRARSESQAQKPRVVLARALALHRSVLVAVDKIPDVYRPELATPVAFWRHWQKARNQLNCVRYTVCSATDGSFPRHWIEVGGWPLGSFQPSSRLNDREKDRNHFHFISISWGD
jgi:hypothetical protein